MRYFIVYIQEEGDWMECGPAEEAGGELVLAMVVKQVGMAVEAARGTGEAWDQS